MQKDKNLKSTRQNISFPIYIVALCIIVIVAINSVIHDPLVGYDSDGHLDYITVIADHLPTEEDSGEFFSPPLPYYIPGIAYQACVFFADTPLLQCKLFGGHFAKGVNFFLAMGITILFIKISRLIKPENKFFTLSALSLLGGMTVFYKTFSQVRGEPYVAFFTVLVVFLTIKMYNDETNWRYASLLGITLGLLVLSRQWGFFLYPAVFFVLVRKNREKIPVSKHLYMVFFTFFVAAVIGGWFYLHLYFEYGALTAFNVEAKSFSLSNQPFSFYRNSGFRDFLLFKSPTRKTFDNQLFPLFYSEIWGDYWGFFIFIREKSPFYAAFANKEQITPYLGRVNFVSLFPTALLFGGMLVGAKRFFQTITKKLHKIDTIAFGFFFLAIAISLLGYAWFLIKYPVHPKGATIKATYMIQLFVILPFLAAEFLEFIRMKMPKMYNLFLFLLGGVFLHNLPAMISRYWWWLR